MVRVIWERPSPIPPAIHHLADRVSVRGRVVKGNGAGMLPSFVGVLVRVPAAGLATIRADGRETAADSSATVEIRLELEALSIGVAP